ncbi:hypothetical protein SacmaDRAFT_1086 [Saccharomonospora marina XMU15]|uniref:Putative sensor domain-containing protein n=1 Tax=Saccharomonospora marina XMU15 TaxID=882083 RepID=H5WW89_9PSEU|nr:sensor domain-containing protein [Saccharomonospora marina]EHR49371.1 hypothetical protein SacmaDRAFT_1086 [Saccharomonospora marina XMU15]
MTAAYPEHPSRTPRPAVAGSVTYLLLNLPAGIAGFVLLVTLGSVGVSTVIVWVGVPVLMLAILLARAFAEVERARIRALLGTYIPRPYRPLPDGGHKVRWKARLSDSSTWRDSCYLLLLFPIGIVEFVLVVTLWAVSFGLLALPVYYRYLPEGAYFFPSYDLRWITVDSVPTALPWAALGVLLLVATVAFTRGLATTHARIARLLLGPSPGRMVDVETDVDQRQPHPVAE